MADNFTPTPVKGLKTSGAAIITNDNIGVLPAVANASAPNWSENTSVYLSTDLLGNLRVSLTGASSINLATVNGNSILTNTGITGNGSPRVTVARDTTTIAGAAPGTAGTASANVLSIQGIASMTPIAISKDSNANSATDPIFVELTDGTAALDTNTGATSAHTLRVTLGTTTGLGAVATTPFFVELSDGTNPLGTATNPVFVSSNATSGTPKISQLNTSGGIAAGASNTFDSSAVTTGKTGYLEQVTLSSSVRWKAQIGTWNGTTFTVAAILFGEAFESFRWVPGLTGNISIAGAATNDFRVIMTNEDNSATADLYTTVEWTER